MTLALHRALEALRSGLVVGVPTDTVYGLAVDPADSKAVERLFELKRRSRDMPVAVLGASFEQVDDLVAWHGDARALASEHWPGPLTAVVRASVPLAAGVGDDDRGTLAVRIPDHDLLRRLLERSGALAVTSANRSGAPPTLDAAGAEAVFGDAVAAYLPGSRTGGLASTVVDLTVIPPKVLRPGPVVLRSD